MGGENICINYSYAESPFGNIFVTSTAKDICHMSFAADEQVGLMILRHHFPKADWYGDSHYAYTNSNTTKQAIP